MHLLMKHLKPMAFRSGHSVRFTDVSIPSMKGIRIALLKECLECYNLLQLRGQVDKVFSQYPELQLHFSRRLFDVFNQSDKVIMLLSILIS